VRCVVTEPDGTTVEFHATHTMNGEQIEWFTTGSALNIIRRKHTGN
jgi:aconitase A